MGMRLTLPQKQIYYTEMFNKDAININCGSVLLDKLYDVKMIEKAVNDIFRINEALRTRVYVENGEPYQYVSDYMEKAIEVLPFKSKDEVHQYGKKQAQIPMDLSGELCEIKVISSEEFCGVFYKVHHIISDAFTFSLISSQIHKLLEGIPVKAGAYSEYIAAEEKYLLGSRIQKDREFFLEQYNNMGDLIYFSDSLPVRGESERLVCHTDKEFTLKIKEFALSQDVSVYAVFLTLISAYISKRKNYSGNFYIGTPVLNRSSVNQMNTAGMFINNVPFPAKVEEDKSFEFNLKKTKDVFFNVLKHQKFNYICALNELNIDQSYDVSFSFQNSTIYGDSFKSTWYHNKVQSESLQIHIDDRDNEGIFNISYDYQIDKFTEKDIKKMHGHLCNLLLDAIENPTKETSALEWLSAEEKQKILHDFNDNAAEYPKDKCVHEVFEELAEKNPGKIAVVACDSSLTYKELNESANRIAHSLIEKGIGRGDIVAFMVPRRSYMISTIIGILKSGAAYLPIDPDYPQERIDYMLSDSDAKFCITEKNITALLDNSKNYNPDLSVKNTDTCYCIYTSGSTGKPKGTLINHGNLINFYIEVDVNEFQHFVAEYCQNILCCGAVSFDIATTEIMLALFLDKTLVLADEEALSGSKHLADLIKRNKIDCVLSTPTKLYTYLLNDNTFSAFAHVKCVLVAGEQLKTDVIEKINKCGDITLFNGYGPTETAMGVSIGKIINNDITIGKPIANTQIYIVDKYMDPVPIGETGELCIGGDGVGAGYLNRPELTEEKFIDNPFGEGKLYKTGDLGYWREDGNIVFVGRNDFQVKVRGLRIELGEIENAITNIDGINMSVVVVRKDNEDRQIICAFYTGAEKSAKEIRSIVGEKLPKYMIPHVFVRLLEMPLTISGKINRNDLPEVDLENIVTETEYVAPATEKEIALAECIKKVLGTEMVSTLDNFFDIGGDSIKAIYIVSELGDMGYELRVADIMQKDTLSDVAKAMKATADKYIYEQGEVSGLVPFSPIMKVYLDANKMISKGFVHTCIVSTDSYENAVRKALDIIVSHHDILRSTFETDGLIIHPSNVQTYSFNSISIADTDEAEAYLKNTGIDSDYLMNVVFCKTAGENLVGITIHHFLVDLISWEILLNDFKLSLEQIKNDSEVSLPAKTASFMMWNEELRKYVENISEATKEYWNNINIELDEAKMFTADTVNKSEEFTFVFDKVTTKKILAEANNKYGTKTNEILLTALGLAAGSIVDGDVGIIVESHGRTELQNPISLGRTVGWFTSCYPVVIKNNKNISDELINTKEVLRRMPSDGIDYLLLGQSMHKNTSIVYNFYKTGFADNGLRSFIGSESLFPDKINVNCYVDNEILKIYISVSECNHRENICEELGTEFVKQLEKMLEICTGSAETIKTRSDFTDDTLTQAELDELRKIEDTNIEDILSLTPAQEGIYAQYFRNADTKTYHLQNLCRIGKNTDIELIEKSVELLAQRHEVLKTAFAVLQSTGAIKQVILANRKPDFKVIASDEKFSQSVLDSIIRNELDKTLDLQKDSLFRVTVIDFEDIRFVYIHTHHIILDGWCFPIFINDLQRYYGELSAGVSTEELLSKISKEKESQTSYAQYVKWIRGQDKEEKTDYWQKLLVDCSVAHIFGKEKKENLKNENIVTFRTSLSADLSRKIEQFAKRSKVTANTVFECAFSIALQKYSGCDDVVFDKIISGRNIPLNNISETLGLFINTVPVRIESDGNTTISDLLNATQNQTIEANKNGILSLADVYRSCGIESQSVDALFVFENYFAGDVQEIENGPLGVKLVSFEEQTEFNLTVTIMKEQNGYTIRTSYAEEMYAESEISGFIRGYISVLETSLDGTKKINDISLADAEKLALFNKTEHLHNIASNTTLYSLFEKTARENTEKICIKTAEREMTFGELCCISENLDAEIRKITDGKKSVIAVIAERSVEMYSAVYGIIRGGNAYLPIDPTYPPDRIEYILGNSNATAVVCQGKFTHLAGKTPCIDITEFLNTTQKSENTLPSCADENDTAYVIYTSGSTGNPKGARVSHKSAINRILWMHEKYPLGKDDVILQKTPYTFDVSVWELFWWGMVGGCLAASRPDEHFLPEKILLEAQKNKVTHIHFVPSVFELFLNYLENHTSEIEKFNSVKYVFLSGEALSASLVNRFYKLYDYEKVTLHNLYGPTECAVDVTYYDCKPDDSDPVPIGKPIYNTQMYIVDKYMNLVPIGVQGELCISGVNVGQGYLNNPELTEEKFIDNPFGEGKLYKTGDVAYWREDGNIIFCGRNDFQVKIHGQRIELGEIEAVINGISGVSSSAVIVKNINGTDVLMAFYAGDAADASFLKECCSDKLPFYMVPGVFVHLDKLPLNSSGKLDRKALAQIDVEPPSDEGFMEPENETEKLICEIFSRILEVENIGKNSDFFRMGGTSLSMISILSEDIFENITAADFIRNSTPAKLARKIVKPAEKTLSYLEPLYISDKTEKTLLLLPFAGGGAEAFSSLVNSMKKKNALMSVYYVRYLHSFEECKKAADEIAAFFKKTDVIFYSHCVGSAVALQIIKELETKEISVKHYFAGASIPPVKPVKMNLWNIVPDGILKTILAKAGADISGLSYEKLREMLISFRKDTDFANISFSELKGKIKTPVSVIISKKDMFTKNYRHARSLWEKYAGNVEQVYYIESDSHYFQSESSERLTDLIVKNIV